MLIALSAGQRVQTISKLYLDNLVKSPDRYVFSFNELLKTSKPGNHFALEIRKFDDTSVCPLTCLKTYLDRTSDIRGDHRCIFLSLNRPVKPVSKQTISRWLTDLLRSCDIDHAFKAHSVRSAATSKAALHTNIDCVLTAAGWKSAQTFAKFYNKPIVNNISFAEAVFTQHTADS
jgi:hypothetical protein